MTVAEYKDNGMIIRSLNKIMIEQDIMNDNSKHFMFACSSPLFKMNELQQIVQFGEKQPAHQLIHNDVPISAPDNILQSFLHILQDKNI